MSNKDTYINTIKLQLDDLNSSMLQLEAKAKETRDDLREKYQEEMTKLQHQSTLAVAKLEEVRATTEGSWEAMVVEMEKVRDAFVHSFSGASLNSL